MENTSKALLMAGGVLLVMLIIALVIFARAQISEYYQERESISEIADVTEFNLQFTNYERDDVHGYELISLANKVADYNKRFSNDSSAVGNDKFNPITMNIELLGNQKDELLWYKTAGSHMFNKGEKITQSLTSNQIETKINLATVIERRYGGSDSATKLAKSIKSLLSASDDDEVSYYANSKGITPDEAKKQLQIAGINSYNSIVGKANAIELTDSNLSLAYNTMKNTLEASTSNIIHYYEYYQFKRAIFECTGITYDELTTRVKTISFKFKGVVE